MQSVFCCSARETRGRLSTVYACMGRVLERLSLTHAGAGANAGTHHHEHENEEKKGARGQWLRRREVRRGQARGTAVMAMMPMTAIVARLTAVHTADSRRSQFYCRSCVYIWAGLCVTVFLHSCRSRYCPGGAGSDCG